MSHTLEQFSELLKSTGLDTPENIALVAKNPSDSLYDSIQELSDLGILTQSCLTKIAEHPDVGSVTICIINLAIAGFYNDYFLKKIIEHSNISDLASGTSSLNSLQNLSIENFNTLIDSNHPLQLSQGLNKLKYSGILNDSTRSALISPEYSHLFLQSDFWGKLPDSISIVDWEELLKAALDSELMSKLDDLIDRMVKEQQIKAKVENYRELPLILNGQALVVSGFKKSYDLEVFVTLKDKFNIGAVISLEEDLSSIYAEAGMAPGFYTYGDAVSIRDWFGTSFEGSERIPVEKYDAIYRAVSAAQAAGKKVAIHCGAGDGRTGTALASLVLRELLEKAYKEQDLDFEKTQAKTEKIYMDYGVSISGGGEVDVTPFVKLAIEETRRRSNHPQSVETHNDVESLILYEQHLREELTLKHKPSELSDDDLDEYTELEVQLEHAAAALEHGKPQAVENFAARRVEGVTAVLESVQEVQHVSAQVSRAVKH